MTIYSQENKVTYISDGKTSSYVVPFYFLDNNISVYLNDKKIEEGEGYIINKSSTSKKGDISLLANTLSGDKITIARDTKLTQEIKEAIAENPFIQRVAKKFDTFVNYAGTKFNSNFKEFSSKIDVFIVSPDQKSMETHIFQAADKLTPEGARLRVLEDMAKEKHFYQDCMHMDCKLPAEVIGKANVMISETKRKHNIE